MISLAVPTIEFQNEPPFFWLEDEEDEEDEGLVGVGSGSMSTISHSPRSESTMRGLEMSWISGLGERGGDIAGGDMEVEGGDEVDDPDRDNERDEDGEEERVSERGEEGGEDEAEREREEREGGGGERLKRDSMEVER